MNNAKGSILIIIIWLLIILTILSVTISSRSRAERDLLRYEIGHINAPYLTRKVIMGVCLKADKEKYFYNLDEIHYKDEDWDGGFTSDGLNIFYKIFCEDARLNLNGKDLKERQLVYMGLDKGICQDIMDYRLTKGERGFEFIEEVSLIKGITPDIYSQIEGYMTVYKGRDSRVNINTADERVLYAVLDGDTAFLNKILDYRKGDDGRFGTGDDGIFRNEDMDVLFRQFGIDIEDIQRYHNLFKSTSDFFRIWIRIILPDRRVVMNIVTIIDRDGRIYLWRET